MTAADLALARARGLAAVRRWHDAVGALAPALAAEATAAEAYCLRAQCLIELGEPRAAAARQALAARPDSDWAHRLLAIALLRTRRRRAAAAEAAEAVRLAPQSVHALHVLAACQMALSRRAAAEQTARAAVAADPNASLAHLTLARMASGRRDYATAEKAYRDGLRLAPDNPDLALGLAQLMHRLGRRDEAATAYLAAARADPADSRARRGLARLGLPVAAAGGAVAVKIAAIAGASSVGRAAPATGHAPRSALAALVPGLGLLTAGTITTALRIRGTRNLPEQIRKGLRSDHRNAALRWLGIAAFFALLLAIWAASMPASAGGGPAIALGFAAFAAAAAFAARRLWTGPKARPIDLAHNLRDRLRLRRR